MQDTPPRRSRRRPPSDSGSSFPLIPIVLGMIVIGFVIGAGLSIAGKHSAEPVAVVTPSPTLAPTLAPATFAPTERPTREPTSEPATRPPATHVPATSAPATMAPSAAIATQAPATRAPLAHTSAALGPAAVAAPSVEPVVSSTPGNASVRPQRTPSRVAVAPVIASATGAPPSADDADSEFGRLAASVVRGYLAAIARGDSASAATSLASSSDRVTEGSIVDATTRIKHVEARGAGDAATVNVDFETATGAYFGQYTVRRISSGAAVIVSHSIIKP